MSAVAILYLLLLGMLLFRGRLTGLLGVLLIGCGVVLAVNAL